MLTKCQYFTSISFHINSLFVSPCFDWSNNIKIVNLFKNKSFKKMNWVKEFLTTRNNFILFLHKESCYQVNLICKCFYLNLIFNFLLLLFQETLFENLKSIFYFHLFTLKKGKLGMILELIIPLISLYFNYFIIFIHFSLMYFITFNPCS